jgi:HD-GYP domain-containing protein (c-di-GMP phosphodiesterase class II)
LTQYHDIGKVGIPDPLLFKKGRLTAGEIETMRLHVEIGHRIAQSIPELAPMADLLLKHHEWWNGQGYPLGLREAEIPLECRIFSIADAYDAMTHDRPDRQALPGKEAAAELRRCAGSQFDPELVDSLLRLLGEENPVIAE